ncbi:MAG TPA: squalene/phytoene synthase family protein [Polyangiales bacterium]|nr:squalene/phytoene synthase family protein [Polyangiales bacterium]
MTHEAGLQDLLHKTSRTFALTIPLLPQPMQHEVGIAYLLFRVIDSFEDATLWAPEERVRALGEFGPLLRDPELRSVCAAAERWVREPPLEHAGYLELIERLPEVLAWHAALRPLAREQIRLHLERTASGMAEFVARTDGQGALQLDTLHELRDYCFVVAGIVGELLTELYVLGCPQLAKVAPRLRERAPLFGEGLQLVNILKDVHPDAEEGRVYLPREVGLHEVFELAHADLRAALEYTELLREGNADLGVVKFNALNARLAVATLRELSDRGLGAKLSRVQLRGVTEDVLRSIHDGASLFPEGGAV